MAVIALRKVPAASAAAEPRLEHFGPAVVTAVLDREVELDISAGGAEARRWAHLAITIAYQPQIGDVVLAIAAVGQCYVIGVIEGRGPTVLNAPGDLELRADSGEVRIAAAQGCIVAAPAVRVEAASLDLIGDTLCEEFATVRHRISEMLEVRAKAICTAVTDTYRLTARRILGRGEDSVSIDAPSINLG
jgi:hypothetical protein